LRHEDKRVICTKIHKGSAPPYYLKNKDIEKVTFIRVGSSNRQASFEMIQELERQKKNVSFDSFLMYSDMDSGQSDIRNKILAPVFKRLGIIEQWGRFEINRR
jgi:predicted HTH transcriptional regulator